MSSSGNSILSQVWGRTQPTKSEIYRERKINQLHDASCTRQVCVRGYAATESIPSSTSSKDTFSVLARQVWGVKDVTTARDVLLVTSRGSVPSTAPAPTTRLASLHTRAQLEARSDTERHRERCAGWGTRDRSRFVQIHMYIAGYVRQRFKTTTPLLKTRTFHTSRDQRLNTHTSTPAHTSTHIPAPRKHTY